MESGFTWTPLSRCRKEASFSLFSWRQDEGGVRIRGAAQDAGGGVTAVGQVRTCLTLAMSLMKASSSTNRRIFLMCWRSDRKSSPILCRKETEQPIREGEANALYGSAQNVTEPINEEYE